MSQDNSASRQRHWEKTRNLTYLVLIVWFTFALIIPWFAGSLNSITFVLLIFFQNWRQDAIDDEYDSTLS